MIMVDAYQDITIPFQMSSVEFFTLVKEHLRDDGVMVVKMNMKSDGEKGINEYLADTISRVFPEVYTVDTGSNTNRELFASSDPYAVERFRKAYPMEEDQDLRRQMARVDDQLIKYEAGDLILTDDKAPVELLSMRAIDAIIREELEYYKVNFKELLM